MHRFIATIGLGVVLLGLGVVACDNPPRGRDTGRIDPAYTTKAESRSRKIQPTALLQASDQVAQALARDLAEIPEITGTQGRVTVLVGDINNKTGIVSSDEFEMVRSRIRNSLLQSGYVRDKLRFVESRGRMTRIQEREGVTGEGAATAYDAATTYALNGDFYRVGRDDTSTYYLEFQLVNFATNEIVFSDRYEIRQERR